MYISPVPQPLPEYAPSEFLALIRQPPAQPHSPAGGRGHALHDLGGPREVVGGRAGEDLRAEDGAKVGQQECSRLRIKQYFYNY